MKREGDVPFWGSYGGQPQDPGWRRGESYATYAGAYHRARDGGDGYREGAESWRTVLRDLKRRGMRAPVLGVGGGALGFWAAASYVMAVMASVGDLFESVGKGHPAIDHHGGPAPAARALFQRRQHVSDGRAIDGIAVKDLVGSWKAVAIQDQPDDHLLAVRAVVARIPACGLRIEPALPFEVRRGQVVVEIEASVLGSELTH